MVDKIKIKAPKDKSFIDTSQDMAYWRNKLGVSSQAISGAVRSTGSSDVKTIKRYLKDKGY